MNAMYVVEEQEPTKKSPLGIIDLPPYIYNRSTLRWEDPVWAMVTETEWSTLGYPIVVIQQQIMGPNCPTT